MKVTIKDHAEDKIYYFNLPKEFKNYQLCLKSILNKMHDFSLLWGEVNNDKDNRQ